MKERFMSWQPSIGPDDPEPEPEPKPDRDRAIVTGPNDDDPPEKC